MTTDGGGYFLVGRKNNSITWTLPSNDLPVEPYGDPHWASNLGDAPILDFRVQIATSEDFQQTKAHWYEISDIETAFLLKYIFKININAQTYPIYSYFN
jgi:hypothetical protein